MSTENNDPTPASLAAAFHAFGESITEDGPVVRAMQQIMFDARQHDTRAGQQPAAVDEVAEHISALRDLYATRNPVGRFARAVKAGIAALSAQQGGGADE